MSDDAAVTEIFDVFFCFIAHEQKYWIKPVDSGDNEQEQFIPEIPMLVMKDMKEVYFLNAGEIAEVSKRDCIHFTEEGHAALGKAVAEKVRELFQ